MSESAVPKTVSTAVHQRGWHLASVKESSHRPPFAYTVGLHHNYKHPELLVVGLPSDLSKSLLDVMGTRISDGAEYSAGEAYRDVLQGYACRFRPVAREAYGAFLRTAVGFYHTRSFPALQCVWPDSRGKFPWDTSYNALLQWKQPLLADPATARVVSDWNFVEPYTLGVFTTAKVLAGEPILMVMHDRDDGGWQFLTGATEAPDQGRRVPLIELVRRDASLNEIGDLALGGMAVRDSRHEAWQRIE